MNPRIAAIGTAVPEYRLDQASARAFAAAVFADDFERIDDLLRLFDRTAIDERQLVRPIQWFTQRRSFVAKNEVYVESALRLSSTAARRAMASADSVVASDIAAIVFVSSTGIATPSLDATLVQRLELRRDIARIPMWGLGCAGGAAGLARARDLCAAHRAPVLLIAVEICSCTFVHGDRRKANLVATALFGDGAAAVLITPDGVGAELVAGVSHLVDDSQDLMGWTITEDGLRVQFSPDIPAVVEHLGPAILGHAEAAGGVGPLHHLVVHPGGRRVLEAYDAKLNLEPARLQASRETLAAHGNMSSPTVLFALDHFTRRTPRDGRPGLALGLGPGFCAEGVVFRW